MVGKGWSSDPCSNIRLLQQEWTQALGGPQVDPRLSSNEAMPSLHMWIRQWGCGRTGATRTYVLHGGARRPKHHPAVCMMVTSTVVQVLMGGGEK